MTVHELGVGVLSWPPDERISDRYGTVKLMNVPHGSPVERKPIVLTIVPSTRGKLFAEVVEIRQSNHFGDLFRDIYPATPEVGDRIKLGFGELFYEADNVGLKPDDGRETDWLDPNALYRAIDQTVKLLFVEETSE